MQALPSILAVDDEAMNREIIHDILSEQFQVSLVESGQACIESIAQQMPDLILLDVDMPEMNGFETCKKIRTLENCAELPIVFLSAMSSSQDRALGYQSGGNDYVTKPFEIEELLTKLAQILEGKRNLLLKEEELEEQKLAAEYASGAAMTAMVNSSEMGTILHFIDDLLTIHSQQDLVSKIFTVLEAYELGGSLMLNHLQTTQFFFNDGKDRPVEKNILTEVMNKGRIIEFSNRAIFNSKHASFLVRNMPFDEDKKGRYKDHLIVVLDAVEEKLMQLCLDDEIKRIYHGLSKSIESTSKKLNEVNLQFQKQRLSNAYIMENAIREVEKSFNILALSEDQEQHLIDILKKYEHEIEKNFSNEQVTSDAFEAIMNELKALNTSKQA